MAGNYTTLDAREFSSTLAAVLILFLPSSSNKTLFSSYQSCIFVTSFHMAECSYESHLTLMIPFPLYYLNFLPTVSVSSKQRRPDLDLCLFIPKSSFASNSDPNNTILFFFHSIYYCFITYRTIFYFIFTPCSLSTLSFFLISSISFVNGYSLFIFLICVFLDGILSLSVVFFTCLLMFPFLSFFCLFS